MDRGPDGYFARILREAGIEQNGQAPWDLEVRNKRLAPRLVAGGALAFGETYMDGWWETRDLGELCYRLLVWQMKRGGGTGRIDWPRIFNNLRRGVFNLQRIGRKAREVVEEHYDLPAHLFEAMLGETMAYSCAYWPGLEKDPENLDAAQRQKLDLICRKLELKKGELVLDLGCGFGSFARYAAENYGVRIVAVNLSSGQLAFAREFCAGLPVEFFQCDYRDTLTYAQGRIFDKVASIAMFEAIGHKNFRGYMEIVDRLLHDQGLFLLHTLGDEECSSNPWMDKYIFPNGELPTIGQLGEAVKGLFHLEDFHNFGQDYGTTLAAWEHRFRERWPEVSARDPARFDQRFFRMWVFYLASCRAALRSRHMYLWQLVMSKGWREEVYRSVR
jgi:cyclopropane-fatty-acyl-phospholipid synthase